MIKNFLYKSTKGEIVIWFYIQEDRCITRML